MIEQYRAIRARAGVTEWSGMGYFRLAGDDARAFLDREASGNIEALPENALRHTLLLDEDGRIAADVQIYNNFDELFVACDAAVRDVVKTRLAAAEGDVRVEDRSGDYTVIAVDGPFAWQVPRALMGAEAGGVRPLNFIDGSIGGVPVRLSRFGLTGEYGYQLFVPNASASLVRAAISNTIPEAVACGPQVHDLLRLEVRSFNRARDLPRQESPIAAGLHWMIHFRKEWFRGGEAIRTMMTRGPGVKMIALKSGDERSPRAGGAILDGARTVGYVANAAVSPELGAGIALGYVEREYAWVGLTLSAESDGGTCSVTAVSAPFVVTRSTHIQIA